MMLGEVREVSPIDIEAHPHVHAEMRVVGVTTSATKCRRARRYATGTTLRTRIRDEEAVKPASLTCNEEVVVGALGDLTQRTYNLSEATSRER